MNSRGERSIAELFSDAFAQLAKLIGNEFDLAKAELSEKAGQMGRGVAMIGAGAIIHDSRSSGPVAVGGFSPYSCRSFRACGISSWRAEQQLAVAGALIAVGVNRMSARRFEAGITIEQLQRDKAAAKEMVR